MPFPTRGKRLVRMKTWAEKSYTPLLTTYPTTTVGLRLQTCSKAMGNGFSFLFLSVTWMKSYYQI